MAKYTKKQMLDILDQAIDIYDNDTSLISYYRVLDTLSEYRQTNWNYYNYAHKDKHPDIVEKFEILRDIQEQRIIEQGMSGNYNPAFSIFFLKSKRGWIERQHSESLAIQREKLKQDKSLLDEVTKINIGFDINDES